MIILICFSSSQGNQLPLWGISAEWHSAWTSSSMADSKYLLLAKYITREQGETTMKKHEIKDKQSTWEDTAIAMKTAGSLYTRALMWPNPEDTHWLRLTRYWDLGHRSTFLSQIQLCPDPNERFLPEMEKSYKDAIKISTLHLVIGIPLCRDNEAGNVPPLTPVGPIRPDGGWSIRKMSVRSKNTLVGKARNFLMHHHAALLWKTICCGLLLLA